MLEMFAQCGVSRLQYPQLNGIDKSGAHPAASGGVGQFIVNH